MAGDREWHSAKDDETRGPAAAGGCAYVQRVVFFRAVGRWEELKKKLMTAFRPGAEEPEQASREGNGVSFPKDKVVPTCLLVGMHANSAGGWYCHLPPGSGRHSAYYLNPWLASWAQAAPLTAVPVVGLRPACLCSSCSPLCHCAALPAPPARPGVHARAI